MYYGTVFYLVHYSTVQYRHLVTVDCNGMENGTAAWNGSLEQMRGTDLEPKCVPIMLMKYFVWNSCMEQKYVLKRVSFGSKDCTKELKLECAYFLDQTS